MMMVLMLVANQYSVPICKMLCSGPDLSLCWALYLRRRTAMCRNGVSSSSQTGQAQRTATCRNELSICFRPSKPDM